MLHYFALFDAYPSIPCYPYFQMEYDKNYGRNDDSTVLRLCSIVTWVQLSMVQVSILTVWKWLWKISPSKYKNAK